MAGDTFYPCGGAETVTSPVLNASNRAGDIVSDGVINITLTPLGPGPWDQAARGKLTVRKREEFCHQASTEMRFDLIYTYFV